MLTAHDRCDRCNAQAYVQVRWPVGSLLFCAHHFAKYEENIGSGVTVTDERDKLQPQVSTESY